MDLKRKVNEILAPWGCLGHVPFSVENLNIAPAVACPLLSVTQR